MSSAFWLRGRTRVLCCGAPAVDAIDAPEMKPPARQRGLSMLMPVVALTLACVVIYFNRSAFGTWAPRTPTAPAQSEVTAAMVSVTQWATKALTCIGRFRDASTNVNVLKTKPLQADPAAAPTSGLAADWPQCREQVRCDLQ